jgi:hypothetical protein
MSRRVPSGVLVDAERQDPQALRLALHTASQWLDALD